MDHLKDERAASSHLDLADVEPEPYEGFKKRALAVELLTEGHDLRDRELL